MVRPQEVIEAILHTFQQCEGLPSETTFVGYEPDIDSEAINLPLVEISTEPMTNISELNSNFVGYRKDNAGNDIGRIYETLWTLQLEVSVWTAHGSKFSPRKLGNTVRDELFSHTTSGPAETLRMPDDTPLDEVWRFAMNEAAQTDDLGTSPTLRRWQQSVTVSASEEYLTDSDEPPISTVNGFLEYDDSNNSSEESITIQ